MKLVSKYHNKGTNIYGYKQSEAVSNKFAIGIMQSHCFVELRSDNISRQQRNDVGVLLMFIYIYGITVQLNSIWNWVLEMLDNQFVDKTVCGF